MDRSRQQGALHHVGKNHKLISISDEPCEVASPNLETALVQNGDRLNRDSSSGDVEAINSAISSDIVTILNIEGTSEAPEEKTFVADGEQMARRRMKPKEHQVDRTRNVSKKVIQGAATARKNSYSRAQKSSKLTTTALKVNSCFKNNLVLSEERGESSARDGMESTNFVHNATVESKKLVQVVEQERMTTTNSADIPP